MGPPTGGADWRFQSCSSRDMAGLPLHGEVDVDPGRLELASQSLEHLDPFTDCGFVEAGVGPQSRQQHRDTPASCSRQPLGTGQKTRSHSSCF